MTPVAISDRAAPRPSFDPRALIVDLDGTCISKGRFLHRRTQEAVRRAAKHRPVVVATGRQYRSALPWVHRLGVTEPVVCYEGALVREVADSPEAPAAVLLDVPLKPAPALETLRIARANDWHCHGYAGDDEIVAERDRPELHAYSDVAGVGFRLVPDLEPVFAQGTPKVVCVIESRSEVERCMRLVSAALGDSAHVTQSRETYVEVVDAKVSKSRACELVCRRHGVRLSETLAIGDAPNDIDLLEAAGFAVAVDSGRHPQVLPHADATCAPPTEGGVADVLELLNLV